MTNYRMKTSFPCPVPGRSSAPVAALQVAEAFHRHPGKYVPLKETIKGFKEVVDGKMDDIPEQAFYMVGAVEEVFEKAEKLGYKR